MPAAPGSANPIENTDSIIYSCSACRKKLKVPSSSAGKQAQCDCGARSQIPTPVSLQVKTTAVPLEDLLGDPLEDPFLAESIPDSEPFSHADSAPFAGHSYATSARKLSQPQTGRKAVSKGKGNTIGLVGFIVSLVSLLIFCGLLSPISAVLSFMGIRRQPKGFAIAGLAISVVGCLYLLGIVLVIIAGFSQISASVEIAMAKAHVHNACVANDGVLPSQFEYEDEAGALADSISYEAFGNQRFVLTHLGADGIHGTSDDLAREFVLDPELGQFVESQ